MAILEQSKTEVGGFEKGIESSAMSLMMDILQRFQYQFPIKSTIRELVSNGLDSLTEKKVAREILQNGKPLSDFFEEMEGEAYQDSKFDPSYYNFNHLSTVDKVLITYHKNSATEKDFVTISDTGVGLGGRRLAKYFSLGFSTKRLSKMPLGKFGIGAKSPLSINPYYTVESIYNGLRYRFNVYNSKVESIIPRFNLETGEENVPIEFELGTVYAEKTSLPNGVTITLEAKKHHFEEYKDAVIKQLMYFEGVEFEVYDLETGLRTPQPFKPTILFEDEYIILSDNTYYSRPHIILNKVNYGFINFEELELSPILGNVGIKVQPEDVQVSPSRESLVWSETTKATILKRFQDASQSASTILQRELSTNDFLQWLRTCCSLSQSSIGSGSVAARLASIVDLRNLDVRFNEKIKFTFNYFKYSTEGLDMLWRVVRLEQIKKKNQVGTKLKRYPITKPLAEVASLPIYLKHTKSSNRKDRYLQALYGDFIVIDAPFTCRNGGEVDETVEIEDEISSAGMVWNMDEARSEYVYNLLKSSPTIKIYEDVEVPDSFKLGDTEEDLKDLESVSEEELQGIQLSLEERRKLEGKTVLFTPRAKNDLHPYKTAEYKQRLFEWQKVEVPVAEIDTWEEDEIYYGSTADRDTIEFVATLMRSDISHLPFSTALRSYGSDMDFSMSNSAAFDPYGVWWGEAERCPYFFDVKDVKLIQVAQDKVKLYKDFKHITKFFARLNGTTLTMSNKLIQWNTARQMIDRMHQLDFMFNFPIVPETAQRSATYHKIYAYVVSNYRNMNISEELKNKNGQAYNDMVSHLDKVAMFQQVVSKGLSAEEIASLATEMWGTPTITDAHAVDLELLAEFEDLLNWAKPVQNLLNGVELLTGHDDYFSTFDKHLVRRSQTLPIVLETAVLDYCRTNNLL